MTRDRLVRPLFVLFILAGTALVGPVRADASPAFDQTTLLDTAARARLTQAAPTVAIERTEIVRVVGDYAIVAVYPKGDLADPAGVILHRQDATWTAVAGPGTAFPPGSSRGGAPDELFEFGPTTSAQGA